MIDLGALLMVLLAVGGFWLFKNVGTSAAQPAQAQTVTLEFNMLIRGLSIGDPERVLKVGDRPKVIIRNQPAGQVVIQKIQLIPDLLPVVRPNGTIEYVPDKSRPYSRDILLVLKTEAQITPDGAVVGGTKLKVATPVELETSLYSIKGSVIDLKTVDQP